MRLSVLDPDGFCVLTWAGTIEKHYTLTMLGPEASFLRLQSFIALPAQSAAQMAETHSAGSNLLRPAASINFIDPSDSGAAEVFAVGLIRSASLCEDHDIDIATQGVQTCLQS